MIMETTARAALRIGTVKTSNARAAQAVAEVN